MGFFQSFRDLRRQLEGFTEGERASSQSFLRVSPSTYSMTMKGTPSTSLAS
jgi:hypothetical protein